MVLGPAGLAQAAVALLAPLVIQPAGPCGRPTCLLALRRAGPSQHPPPLTCLSCDSYTTREPIRAWHLASAALKLALALPAE